MREYLIRLRWPAGIGCPECQRVMVWRTSRHRGKLFYRLVQQAVAVEPQPYKKMVGHARGRQPGKHKP